MEWTEVIGQHHDSFNQILSFDEYLEVLERFSVREIRSSSLYFKDMFNHFGVDQNGAFKLFHREAPDSPPVHGQMAAQQAIYQNLINFSEEGFNNKFILLVGPNGSSKSSLVRKVMNGLEDYSQSEEGTLYTFSWIFPIESFIRGQLGLHSTNTGRSLKTYAHIDDNEINAILTSDLKDHPLLLIPPKPRQKLIEEKLADRPKVLDSVKKSYLYYGDVSKRNRMIYDALLKSYKGDHQEVLKHIRVERFVISKRYSSGAVTIEPQLHVDAKMQQITMDRRLASLPPSLQSLNLFGLHGEVVLANRGVLEFSDLLKRPLDTFKYLLMTMETKTINLQGILTELDIFFIGSSNELHLSAFKQHPDFNSFKGRINFVRVPYLLNALEEEKIYLEQVQNLKDKTHFSPHSLETLCLFAVMTRLRPAQVKNSPNKNLSKIATSLTPLEKALLLTSTYIPERMDSEDKKTLKMGLGEIRTEFENENLYEGKFGISPREVKQLIYEIATKYQHVTFIEILEYLVKFIERKNEYDFLNIAAQGEFNNPVRFIESLKDHNLAVFENELRECLGLVDKRSYEDYISKYILNVSAIIKKEKVKNPITGKFEEPSAHLIKEFEASIQLKEGPEQFRSHLISALGAYSLDNPGKSIIYTDVFPDMVKKLQESFREEQKKAISKVAQNLVYYVTEEESKKEQKHAHSQLTEEGRKEIQIILNNLQDKFNYSKMGALTLVKYLIKERY